MDEPKIFNVEVYASINDGMRRLASSTPIEITNEGDGWISLQNEDGTLQAWFYKPLRVIVKDTEFK